jgi:NitT/TauT family transport system permease protein
MRHAGLYGIAVLCLAALALALFAPLAETGPPLLAHPLAAALVAVAVLACLAVALVIRSAPAAFLVAALASGGSALILLQDATMAGNARAGFWGLCLCSAAGMCGALTGLTSLDLHGRLARLRDVAVPALFGVTLLGGAEMIIRGAGVPPVLLPAPSAVGVRFFHVLPMLTEDFVQTFVKGVLTGYAIGNLAGFLVAMAVQKSPFLARGLLPLGNFLSSLPIVGIAPIMVMWFGFDWPSKAAVVALITFFPMLANAATGLSTVQRIDLDLMHSYGATFGQQFMKLRLPSSMPFVFNALKINSTLALIGAIVAEFFGTPTKGMGFRISIEAARMSMDVVWAEILLAALVGTGFYGLLVILERLVTFWHVSYRA